MGVIIGIVLSIVSILLIVVLRSFTTLFHELGHAIPALLFTEERVTVYVGTYGDISNSVELHIGRLTVYFRINLFDLKIGLCSFSSTDKIWHNILITIGGPVASLMIAIPLAILCFYIEMPLVMILLVAIFSIAAVIDFIINMIPLSKPIRLHNGETAYNDGYQLLATVKRMNLSKEYLKMEELLEEQKYQKAITFGEESIKLKMSRSVFGLLLQAYVKSGKKKEALLAYDEYIKDFKLDYKDYFTLGSIYKELGNKEEAMVYFDHCFFMRFDDPLLLKEIGEIRLEQELYKESIQRLTGAIMFSEDFHEPYLLRGIAYLKLKQYDAAKSDFNHSLKHDPESFSAYYNLGLLYERVGDYKSSFEAFETAYQIKPETPGLAFKIELIREHVVY